MNPNGYRIIKCKVSIKNLYWDGNSIAELGYDDGNTYAYRDTVNNRKLLDPVTYDEYGNVIPLSKRFKYRNSDTRYSRELDFIDYVNEKTKAERANMTKAQLVAQARSELEAMNVGKGELMAVQKVAEKLFEQYGGEARYQGDELQMD